MNDKTTIILHHQKELSLQFAETIQSIVQQTNQNFEVIIIGVPDSATSDLLNEKSISFHKIPLLDKNPGALLNAAVTESTGSNILYIDNQASPVTLKKAALDTFQISALRNQDGGLFYADYELEDDGTIHEKKLLSHHIGRVRDNQDYGKVCFIRKEALENIPFDETIKYNALYDFRLKISEQYKLIRISNKFNGSLYRVKAEGKAANVFDYLLSGKEVQLEAEEILTNHLKQIGAYLKPGHLVPVTKKHEDTSTLTASVIIPVGHRPEFIGVAIESIQAQTIQEVEGIIVVNGGDDDPTAAVVKKYIKGGELYDPDKPEIRLFVIDINNIGLCLNLGANNARGKYYVQLDSDDRLKPDAVEQIINCFQSSANVGMVIGSYEVWEKNEDGSMSRMEEIPVVTHDEWTDTNGRNNLMRINGAGAPRSIPIHLIKDMGYFNINDDPFSRNYGEDYEMVNKIAEHFKIGRVYDPIYEVVRHSGGTDHAINQDVVDRNDEAKDDFRREAILRRIEYNTI